MLNFYLLEPIEKRPKDPSYISLQIESVIML